MENGESSYRRFLDGDESGFDEIVGCFRSPLTFFILRFVGDFATAEELCADVFAELFMHPKRYRFGESLKTYLYTMARSRALDELRRRRRHAAEPLDEISETADIETLESKIIQTERKRALYKSINTLPNDYKTAIYLVYFEQMSYEQTARVMKKNVKQVSNLVYRAKSMLRLSLEKEGCITDYENG